MTKSMKELAFWFTVTKPVYRILYRISYYTK
jgi:hypothetical protein